jgi:hypothetical protein
MSDWWWIGEWTAADTEFLKYCKYRKEKGLNVPEIDETKERYYDGYLDSGMPYAIVDENDKPVSLFAKSKSKSEYVKQQQEVTSELQPHISLDELILSKRNKKRITIREEQQEEEEEQV